MIQIPVYRSVRYMVHDECGALRGFNTKREALHWIGDTKEYWVVPVQQKYIEVEEAPF